jgi:hypothetical protein
MVADRSLQRGIFAFKSIENAALRHVAFDFQKNFATDAGEGSQMSGKFDSDPSGLAHGRVWTSTDNTAGRSRTMGFQLSPALEDT